MSGLRALVTGSDVCAPSGGVGAGPSNAMAGLVIALIGSAGKTQENLREARQVGGGWVAVHAILMFMTYTEIEGREAALASCAWPPGMLGCPRICSRLLQLEIPRIIMDSGIDSGEASERAEHFLLLYKTTNISFS